MQNSRYQGGLILVLSGMQRIRAWNQTGKINNKFASPKIFHLLSLLLCVFYHYSVLITKIKGRPFLRAVQWWLWVALCNNLLVVTAQRENQEIDWHSKTNFYICIYFFNVYCAQNVYEVISWEDSSYPLGLEGRDFFLVSSWSLIIAVHYMEEKGAYQKLWLLSAPWAAEHCK